MEVKTNVFLSEADVRVIVKKHLEKQGFKIKLHRKWGFFMPIIIRIFVL